MKVKNKSMVLSVILILCLGLASCSVKTADAPVSPNAQAAQPSQAQTQPPETQTPGEASIEPIGSDPLSLPPYSFDIEGKNWNVEGITVKYPMLVNSNTQDKTDAANDLIMNDMSKLIETIRSGSDDETLTIDGVFDYTQIAPTVLSVCYNIDYYADSMVYPVSLYHTITLSLEQAEAIPLSDLFVIDETFVKDFKSYWMYAPFRDLDLEAAGVNIKEEIESLYSDEDLQRLFSQTDAQYYLTDQGLFISIEVPHVLGDHLEMAMKYEFLEASMKKDHPLWENYMFLAGDASEG